jgi:hypothetical protein
MSTQNEVQTNDLPGRDGDQGSDLTRRDEGQGNNLPEQDEDHHNGLPGGDEDTDIPTGMITIVNFKSCL